MAVKRIFGLNLDLNLNQLLNPIIHNRLLSPGGIAGQLLYNTANDQIYVYDGTDWQSLQTSGMADLGGGTSEGNAFLIGAGSTLGFTAGGTIDANLFFGSGIIPVAKGGTGRSSIPTGAIIYGNTEQTLEYDSSLLVFNNVSGHLGIGYRDWTATGSMPLGTIHIGTGKENVPPIFLESRSLVGGSLSNFIGSIEFDGDLHYIASDSARRTLAWQGMSVTGFGGVLPISKGGTSATNPTGAMQGLAEFTASGQIIHAVGSGAPGLLVPTGDNFVLSYATTTGLFWADINDARVDHGSLGGLADDDHLQYVDIAPTSTLRNVILSTVGSGQVGLSIVAPGLSVVPVDYDLFRVRDTLDNYNVFGVEETDVGAFNVHVEASALKLFDLGSIYFYEDSGNGENFVALNAPNDITSTFTITLPDAQGGAGEYLLNDGVGILSWGDHGDLAGLADDDHLQYIATGVGTDSNRNLITADNGTTRLLHIRQGGASVTGSPDLVLIETNNDAHLLRIHYDGSNYVVQTDVKFVCTTGVDVTGTLQVRGILAIHDNNPLQLFESEAGGENFISLKAPTGMGNSRIIYLPEIDGTGVVPSGGVGSGQILFFDGNHWLGGAAGGGGSTTLQQAYDLSTSPEILTDGTRTAVDFRRGSTADTDNVITIQNGAGSPTAQFQGDGKVIVNELEVSGTNNLIIFPSTFDGTGLVPSGIATSGHGLRFDGLAWMPQTLSAGGDIGDLGDVTITGPTTLDVLQWNGSAWVDRSLAEAGISPTGHDHDAVYLKLDSSNDPLTSELEAPSFTGDFFQFDITFADGTTEGRLQWNNVDGTLEFGLPGGSVNLRIGQEMVVRSRNTTGVTILKGSVVIIVGSSGNKPLIALADASSDATADVFGFAAEDIVHNDNGYVSIAGRVAGVDTDGMTEGDHIYLSETAGEFTEVPPTPPASITHIGFVLSVHASTGEIFATIHHQVHLNEDVSDVLVTGIGSDEILKWNGTLWVNNTLAEAGISASGHTHVETDITDLKLSDIGASFDGGGSAVPSGSLTARVVIQACTIDSAAMEMGGTTDVSTVTIRKYTPATGVRGSATAMGTIAVSGKDHATDNVGGWSNTSLASGDIIEYEVTSAPAIATRLSVTLARVF